MPFMQPEILRDDWYEIQANHGETYWLPVDVADNPAGLSDGDTVSADDHADAEWSVTRSAVRDYCEGEPESVTMRRGWYGARLSAPGYMDCTEWAVFPTEAEARAYLRESYDCCPDCGEDCSEEGEGFCQCPDHAADSDCAADIDAGGTCLRCGVLHGDPCHACGGRAFHKPACPVLTAERG